MIIHINFVLLVTLLWSLLLSLSNFNLLKSGLPTDSLTHLSHKIKPFIDDNLSENEIKNKLSDELFNFGKSWHF